MTSSSGIRFPSNDWLLGATVGSYLTMSFIVRFWGEGLLLPANDVAYVNGPPPESHMDAAIFLLVGVLVTALGMLQAVSRVEISETWTRWSLWFNFAAILFFAIGAFGTRHLNMIVHAIDLLLVAVSFPLGVGSGLINAIGGALRRKQANTR
jgi:hypothetical protein